MLFKIVCGTEVHVLNSLDLLSFQSLSKFINDRFKKLPSQFFLTYKDSDEDQICLSSQNDMELLQCLGLKKVRILITNCENKKNDVFEKIDIQYQSSSSEDEIQSLSEKQICLISCKKSTFQEESNVSIQLNDEENKSSKEDNEQSCFSQEEKEFYSRPQVNEQQIHEGYMCDGCEISPIVGPRYKCSVCRDFDFCAQCESTFEHQHPFLKIKNIYQAPKEIHVVLEGAKKVEKKEKNIFSRIFSKLINWDYDEAQQEDKIEIPKLKKSDQVEKIEGQMEKASYLSKILRRDYKKCYEFAKKYPLLNTQQLVVKFFNNTKVLD